LSKFAETITLWHIWQLVELECALKSHVSGKVREFNLNQLLGVERAVVVAASSNRLGQHHPSRVHSLKNALLVDSAGYLPDQNWSNTLRPQLLVDTQKVDFHHTLHPTGTVV